MNSTIKNRRQARPAPNPQSARPLQRRRALPSGRALVGGFLIAAAATGTYATIAFGNGGRVNYVIATQPLVTGQTITASDLAVAPMALSPQLSHGLAFSSPSALVGAIAIAPFKAGELIQSSDVVQSSGAPGQRDLSFSLAASRALNGSLVPGDKVDVLATFGSSASAFTQVIVQSSAVISSSSSTSGLAAGSGQVTVTLGVPTASDALALAHAVDAGQVTLVRSTGDPQGSYPTVYPPGTTGALPLPSSAAQIPATKNRG